MFKIIIPFPPSANKLWEPGKKRPGRTNNVRCVPTKFIPTMRKSNTYKAWQEEALWMIKSQRVEPVNGHYVMYLLMPRIDLRRRDLDNLFKASSDIVKHSGLIEDDHLCDSAHVVWVSKGEPPQIIVEGVDEENPARADLRARLFASLADD
jgi:crossover junction endodeoxyribonuclease RusA